jgi:hypothetical protein
MKGAARDGKCLSPQMTDPHALLHEMILWAEPVANRDLKLWMGVANLWAARGIARRNQSAGSRTDLLVPHRKREFLSLGQHEPFVRQAVLQT